MRVSRPPVSLLPALIAACLAPVAQAQYVQQGPKLVSPGATDLANSIAVSADGNTAVFGGSSDDSLKGSIVVFVRSNGTWTQQGPKLQGTGGNGQQGKSVAISADGNTIIEGGVGNNGGAWIFTRSGGVWAQQGNELVGTQSGLSGQGSAVALSADGNTAFVGGAEDNFATGAVWIYTRSGSVWSQVGNKIVGTGATGSARQGGSIACSADGSVLIVAGSTDAGYTGAAWIWVKSGNSWTQQGLKLVGTGATTTTFQNTSVAMSADGQTAVIGRDLDGGSAGAAWIFTNSGGTWTQQGGKLTGAGAVGNAHQAAGVAISGDGNTVVLGGPQDNTLSGAAWVFQRSNGSWNQLGNKLVGTTNSGFAGTAVGISGDASTVIVGAYANFTNSASGGGAAWVYTSLPTTIPAGPFPSLASPAAGSGTAQTFTFNFSDSGGWQKLSVVNVLINSALDGRNACYVAFVPSGANAGSVYLVDDAGDAAGPYQGLVLPGSGSINNKQCTINGAGSSVSASGNVLTLTLQVTFGFFFSGNKVFYVAAGEPAANSGWHPQGTWNVPGGGGSGPSVSPLTNGYTTGLTQNLTFTFNDSKGWQDLTVTNVLINSAINGVSACWIAFAPTGANSGAVYLVDDAGDAAGPYIGMVLPTAGAVNNAQCTIAGANSVVSASGNSVQLTLAVTFTQAFGGNRIVYAAAGSATQNSGWQAVGEVVVQ